MAIGADRSGRISTIVHEAQTETSRYNAYEDNVMTGPRFQYTAPNMRSTYRVVPLDINPGCPIRGPGAGDAGATAPLETREAARHG